MPLSAREHRDVYFIPQNFIDTGSLFGGSVRLRNAVEASALAAGTGIPLMYLPLPFNWRLILVIVISLPLAIFAVVGIEGDSLTEFLAHWFRFLRRRRIVTATEDGNLEANKRRHLRSINRKKYRVVYYSDDSELPKGAKIVRKRSTTPGKLARSQTLYDLLPIQKIQNGILSTTDGRYLKILEIEPINFLLRSPREQRNVIQSFASMLKIVPVRLQFKSVAQKAAVNAYLAKLREDESLETDPNVIPHHEDYIRFVSRLGSRDAVSRRFFVIFQYESPVNERNTPYAEIVSMLETTARNFRTYLGQCGNQVLEHENEDEFITEVFYNLLNRQTAVRHPLPDRIQDVLASFLAGDDTTSLDDIPANAFLIPPSIDFKHGKYVCVDGLCCAYLMIPVSGYRSQVTAGWLSLLVNAGEGIDVDLFMERQPKEKMIQKIGQQIRINRSKIKETSDTNTDYDDLAGAIRSGYFLKDGLANGEDFYYTAILVTVTATNTRDLFWRIGELRKLCISQDLDLQLCRFRQEAAFLSALPLCSPDPGLFKKFRRNMLTFGVASCYPLVSYELCDRNGVLLGVNQYNNSLVSLNNFDTRIYKNGGIALMGTSGAGKTFTTQLITHRFRLSGVPVYIIAPLKGHEFYRMCKSVGGTFIRLGPGSPDTINFMEIRKQDRRSQEILDGAALQRSVLAAQIQTLHVLFSLRLRDMTNEEAQILDEALIETYARKGITHDNDSLLDPHDPNRYREMPIPGDLYAVLKEKPRAHRLANAISVFVTGSASNFNRQTNVDLNNPYTVIDISDLTGDMLVVGTFIAFTFTFAKVKEDITKAKLLVVDEAWQIIGASSNSLAANYIFEAVKTIRGYGGAPLIATQDISDFFTLEDGKYGRGILNNCKIKIILNLEEDEAQLVQKVLKLTDAEIDLITRFERGNALISTNSNHVTVAIRCSQMEQELITTDREELRLIVERELKKKSNQEEASL